VPDAKRQWLDLAIITGEGLRPAVTEAFEKFTPSLALLLLLARA
jgi:hypothetical protein